MTDFILSAALRQARSSFRYIDSTGVSRAGYTGVVQSTNYGGDRIGATIDFTPMGGRPAADQALRRQLLATIMRLRGKTNRIYLQDSSYVQGGSFPSTELIANTDFSSTSGYTAGSEASLSVGDNVLRVLRTSNPGSSGVNHYALLHPAATVQYAPYAFRYHIPTVRGTMNARPSLGGNMAVVSLDSVSTVPAYLRAVGVATGTSGVDAYFDNITPGASFPGDYFDIDFVSFSRCFVVDGAANLLLQSNSLATTWTKTGLTAPSSNNTDIAPDGSTTGETLTENTSGGGHFLSQNVTVLAAAADYSISVSLKASSRFWAYVQITENTGSTVVSAYINLNTGGSIGTTTTGANWSGTRVSSVAQGNGWYRITLVSRKTNAATSLTAIVGIASADNTPTYTGASLSIGAYGVSLSASSFPTRLRETTTTAVTAETQQSTAIYVKGLPASTLGLLLAGDQVEIDGQIKFLTASLDSDAAGLGYLQFSPPLRRAVSDNTPVIVFKPMGRFMLAGDASGWSNDPGVFSQAALDLEEAFS